MNGIDPDYELPDEAPEHFDAVESARRRFTEGTDLLLAGEHLIRG